MRVRMPSGILELSIEGKTIVPDTEGTFEVPPSAIPFITSHGGVVETAIADLEAAAEMAEALLLSAQQRVELLRHDAAQAHARVEAAKAKAFQRVQLRSVPSSLSPQPQ